MTMNLVLADPHPVVLEGLAHALREFPACSVKACVGTGDAVLQAIAQHQPHMVVMDLSLTQRSGLAVLAEIKASGLTTRPVVFTGAPIGEVMRALALDVPGLVSKEKPAHALLRCIQTVHAGGTWLDPELTVKTMSLFLQQQQKHSAPSQLLTPRELAVAQMASHGLPTKKIATQLFISEGTAKLHLHHIYQKLDCPGRMALQRYMQVHGGA